MAHKYQHNNTNTPPEHRTVVHTPTLTGSRATGMHAGTSAQIAARRR